MEYPELRKVAQGLAERDNPAAVLIEDKASGQSLIQSLRADTALPVLPVKVDSDKETRAYAVQGLIESGKVKLPPSATWLPDFVSECSEFPNGAHDDQVDSMTQALNWMRPANRYWLA
jgi:predicted phage terminase large subunit-like protein